MDKALREKLHADLRTGVEQLGLSLPQGAEDRLLDFLALLKKWNRAYNLTGIRDLGEMVAVHLLDSLAVVPHVAGAAVADIGSGAGLPSIPLALALPDIRFTLLESRDKRVQFLLHAVAALGLGNVQVVRTRVESFRPGFKFDTLTARAFAPLPDLVAACQHLLPSGGRLLALQGRRAGSELHALPDAGYEIEVIPLKIPMLKRTRHLIILHATRTLADRRAFGPRGA